VQQNVQITYTLYKAATNIIKKKMKKSKYNVYGYKAMGPFREKTFIDYIVYK
jgi:hypothetical protein